LPYGGVCPHCRGAGRTWRYVCRHCAGSGRERRRLSCGVRIPAGVRDGEVLEVDLGRFGGVALARVRVT
jgi:molecular chaperone DnaJ